MPHVTNEILDGITDIFQERMSERTVEQIADVGCCGEGCDFVVAREGTGCVPKECGIFSLEHGSVELPMMLFGLWGFWLVSLDSIATRTEILFRLGLFQCVRQEVAVLGASRSGASRSAGELFSRKG